MIYNFLLDYCKGHFGFQAFSCKNTLNMAENQVEEMVHLMQRFSWVDYVVFVLMLAISAVVGVYWGFFKKQSTQADYLLGGRNMKVVPVAMSLVAR